MFVHRHVGFAGERIAGIKTRAVTADSPLVPERLEKGLAQGDAAILNGMMGIHRQGRPRISTCKSTTACLANSVNM